MRNEKMREEERLVLYYLFLNYLFFNYMQLLIRNRKGEIKRKYLHSFHFIWTFILYREKSHSNIDFLRLQCWIVRTLKPSKSHS